MDAQDSSPPLSGRVTPCSTALTRGGLPSNDEPHDLGYQRPEPEGLVMPPGIVGELRGSEAVESANAGLGDFRSSFCGSTSVNASSAMDSR
jgi:hypothetical protein